MKVDYLTINFATSIISSRTKHESFDSFGSHAQLFYLMGIPISFNVMSLSSLFCSYSKISKLKDQNIRRTLPTKEKIYNCQQSCFFLFFFIFNFKFLIYIYFSFFFTSNPKNSSFLYIGRRFGIG